MQLADLENIRVVLMDDDHQQLHDMKDGMVAAGMPNILATDDIEQAISVVRAGRAELVIGSAEMAGGAFNRMVRDIRHREFANNPFIVAVSLVKTPSPQSIRAIIDSGTDHALTAPLNMDELGRTLSVLTLKRKPFVVTTDYIGPDRRSNERNEGMKIPRIVVPNPLRQRMTGHMKESTMQRSIDACWASINEQKIERHAFQIGWLLERIMPEVVTAPDDRSDDFAAHVSRLLDVARDMGRRIEKTRFAHVREMALTLANLLEDTSAQGFPAQDSQLIAKLAEIIINSFRQEDFDDAPGGRSLPGNPASVRVRASSLN